VFLLVRQCQVPHFNYPNGFSQFFFNKIIFGSYVWSSCNQILEYSMWIKSQQMQQNSFVANLMSAKHASGTIMPIIRSSRLYRWLRQVVRNTLVCRSLVWCGTVGYVSGTRDVTRSNIRVTSRVTMHDQTHSRSGMQVRLIASFLCMNASNLEVRNLGTSSM
jgi:hypothetical protein